MFDDIKMHANLRLIVVSFVLVTFLSFWGYSLAINKNGLSDNPVDADPFVVLSQNEVQAAEAPKKFSLFQKISKLSGKITPTSTDAQNNVVQTLLTDNDNTADSGDQAQASPFPTPTLVKIVVPTLIPTAYVANQTILPTQTTIPTQTPVPQIGDSGAKSQRKEVFLSPPGNFTSEGRGNVVIITNENTNGYWDFYVTASFEKLMPGRNYQLWLMNNNGSSCNEAKFTSDQNGNGSISATITHNQAKDPLSVVKIYEIPPEGQEVPNDPTACFMLSNTSIPCLAGSVYF